MYELILCTRTKSRDRKAVLRHFLSTPPSQYLKFTNSDDRQIPLTYGMANPSVPSLGNLSNPVFPFSLLEDCGFQGIKRLVDRIVHKPVISGSDCGDVSQV